MTELIIYILKTVCFCFAIYCECYFLAFLALIYFGESEIIKIVTKKDTE